MNIMDESTKKMENLQASTSNIYVWDLRNFKVCTTPTSKVILSYGAASRGGSLLPKPGMFSSFKSRGPKSRASAKRQRRRELSCNGPGNPEGLAVMFNRGWQWLLRTSWLACNRNISMKRGMLSRPQISYDKRLPWGTGAATVAVEKR